MPYSARNASIGSTRVARRAGIQLDAAVTVTSASATADSASGSVALLSTWLSLTRIH